MMQTYFNPLYSSITSFTSNYIITSLASLDKRIYGVFAAIFGLIYVIKSSSQKHIAKKAAIPKVDTTPGVLKCVPTVNDVVVDDPKEKFKAFVKEAQKYRYPRAKASDEFKDFKNFEKNKHISYFFNLLLEEGEKKNEVIEIIDHGVKMQDCHYWPPEKQILMQGIYEAFIDNWEKNHPQGSAGELANYLYLKSPFKDIEDWSHLTQAIIEKRTDFSSVAAELIKLLPTNEKGIHTDTTTTIFSNVLYAAKKIEDFEIVFTLMESREFDRKIFKDSRQFAFKESRESVFKKSRGFVFKESKEFVFRESEVFVFKESREFYCKIANILKEEQLSLFIHAAQKKYDTTLHFIGFIEDFISQLTTDEQCQACWQDSQVKCVTAILKGCIQVIDLKSLLNGFSKNSPCFDFQRVFEIVKSLAEANKENYISM